MGTTTVKKGDTGPSLLRQLSQGGATFDVSAATWDVLVSGEVDVDGTSLFSLRDVTVDSKANGTPAIGKLAIPIWDGRTALGSSGTETVVDYTANGKINVTFAASGGTGGTITQEIYRTVAGGSTYYFVASVVDGAHAVSPYVDNTPDASLEQTTHTLGQSATSGYTALPTPPTPTAALAGAGAGLLSNGIYLYKILNKRAADTDTVRKIRWEIIIKNATTGAMTTFPESGFEYLNVVDDV